LTRRHSLKSSMKNALIFLVLLGGLNGCSSEAPSARGSGRYQLDAWADNWFSMSIDEKLMVEDSVSITTERSFNAEIFRFDAEYPMNLNFILKDYKANDTGLEYIGLSNQQMGDGGFIAQITDTTTGNVVVSSNSAWKCQVIHRAPTNSTCEKDAKPESTCMSEISAEPAGWMGATFDTSGWSNATEYTEAAVSPKDGYEQIEWNAAAKLIWTSSLKMDNTLLCKVTVASP
jgi:hypothetical protein